MDTILPHKHLGVLRDWLKQLRLLNALLVDKPVFTRDAVGSCSVCLFASDSPPQARPISPAFSEDGEEFYTCFVEYKGRIHQIYWENSMQYPNLDCFPSLQGTCRPVTLRASMAELFASSTLVNYGVDGCIRCSHNELLPIVKTAHPRPVSRARIQHEIKMLKEMKRHSIPVPLCDPEPLVDVEGIYGYRMEKLAPLDFNNLSSVSTELRHIINGLHECGLSHGDLNPSNIMRDGSGRLVLIDPSFAGQLGKPTPSHIPSWQYEGSVFSTTTDDRYLQQFFS